MAEEQKVVTTETPKKKRRGISNETKATSSLKFTEADANKQLLFQAVVKEVNVSWATIENGGGSIGQFAGHAIPRLNVHFVSLHQNDTEKRHVFLTINPVASSTETIPGGKEEYRVTGNFRWIKHILDTFYLNGRNLTEAEEDALALPYEDYNEHEDGSIEYIPVDTDDVIKGWQVVFENTAAMLNGTWSDGVKPATGKPCYKDANGKEIAVFIKLLRYIRNRNKGWKAINNGDLSFPISVGEGCIERMKGLNVPASILKVNPINESITPKKEAEPRVPGQPTNLPGGMPGGIPMNDFGAGYTNDYNEQTAEEMPF